MGKARWPGIAVEMGCNESRPSMQPFFEKMLQYYVSIENKPPAIVQKALAFQQNPTMFVKSEVDLLAEHVNTLVSETVDLYLADKEKTGDKEEATLNEGVVASLVSTFANY